LTHLLFVLQYRPHALDKFALHQDIAANLKKLVRNGVQTTLMVLLETSCTHSPAASLECLQVQQLSWQLDTTSSLYYKSLVAEDRNLPCVSACSAAGCIR
jgi:hypothetical protein